MSETKEKKKTELTKEAEGKQEIAKSGNNGLKTLNDKYIDNLMRESEKMMNLMELKMTPGIKNSLFELCLACGKAVKEKEIEWKQVDMNGLASNILNYARLEFSPLNNEIYLIPYKNGTQKMEDGKTVDKYYIDFEESYLGKKKKALRFSDLKDIIAFVVREDDIYEPIYDFKEGDTVTFQPKPFNTSPVIGAACYLRYNDESKNRIVEMSLEELNQVKEASKAKMNNKISPAWQKWESEMQKKAVLKRSLKDVKIEVPLELTEAYFETEKLDNSNYDLSFEERKTVVINKNDVIDAEFDEKTGEVEPSEKLKHQTSEEIILEKKENEETNDSDYDEFE